MSSWYKYRKFSVAERAAGLAGITRHTLPAELTIDSMPELRAEVLRNDPETYYAVLEVERLAGNHFDRMKSRLLTRDEVWRQYWFKVNPHDS